MDRLEIIGRKQDWQYLLTFLPEGWREQARELGALVRCRKFPDAESLLRTLLIHLADGCSLRETATRAKQGKIVSISDVALLKRLKSSGEWLRWMAQRVMEEWIDKQPSAIFGEDLKIRVVDSSTIQEPGSTGSTWRIHYSICLPSLRCDEVHITSPKTGESFKRFDIKSADLFVGDRGYAHPPGIAHVVNGGGAVLVRINLTTVPLVDEKGASFPLLQQLRTLRGRKVGDWDVWVKHREVTIAGRVCAIRKSKAAAEKARRKALRDNGRKGAKVRPETSESAAYTFVFTTLDRKVRPTTVLEVYRGRWQIELVFKRLKSIIGLGHLKNKDFQAAQAWMHGKLLVAFLVEALIVAAERFFPWGYPIAKEYAQGSLPLAGNVIDATSP